MDTKQNHPSLDLQDFIERHILPRYQHFDRAHNMQHVMSVIRRSLALAKKTGADINMVYAVAAYHDLGLDGPRAIHHITGGKILKADQRLRQWFSAEQIDIMAQAVEDHRASASRAPRSLYGMIVAEADRDLSPATVISRTIDYGLDHYPEMNRQQQWERFYEHMMQKYSSEGYIRLWIPGSDNHHHLSALREIIDNTELLRQEFEKAYDEKIIPTHTISGSRDDGRRPVYSPAR